MLPPVVLSVGGSTAGLRHSQLWCAQRVRSSTGPAVGLCAAQVPSHSCWGHPGVSGCSCLHVCAVAATAAGSSPSSLGLAYAGSNREEVLESVIPALTDADSTPEVRPTPCLAHS